MADSVKDLVVRLSFEHGDTQSRIAAIKGELKLLDSEFKAAAAQAGSFSSGLNRSAAQASTLEKKAALQKQAVAQYGDALKQAEARVKQAAQTHGQYGQKLEETKGKSAALKGAIEGQKASLKELADAGLKNTSVYAEEAAELERLKEEYREAQKEVAKLEGAYAKSDKAMADADRRVQRLTAAQNGARAAQAEMERELERLNQRVKNHADALEAASAKLKTYSESAKSAGAWQTKLGGAMSKASAGIVSAGAAAAGAAVQWESDFAGVRKTVNGTAEELEAIEQALLDMGENKGAKYSELAEIAANAGQLGIATSNVAAFTGTMADLAQTTDLTAGAASTAFAQYANITRMPQENISRLGSVTVELGNNLATTESKTVDFATAIAAAGSQAKMTDAEIFGIAAGLSSLGLEAQAGGTAFSRALSGMQAAVETGSEDLQRYADVAGMSAQEFADAFQTDAAGAFIRFVQGLSSGSQSAIVMLDEMGVTETRLRDTLLRASSASDLLTQSVSMANAAWEQNTALTQEASVRYATSASRMQMLGNKVQRTAISFGNSLLPVLEDVMGAADGIVEKFSGLDESQRKQILTWGAYAAAAGPAVTLIGKANGAIGTATGALSKMFSAMASGGASLSSVAGSVGALLGPAGIAALAAGAGLAAYKFIDWASGAKAARDAMEDMIGVAKELRETTASTVYDTGTADPLARFGLSKDSFSTSAKEAQSWMDELMRVWPDGERETDAIVSGFSDQFAAASDGVREKIQQRSALLSDLDVLDDGAKAQMESDLEQLDAWDAEIAALLKKRQNGFLTGEEQDRLGEVVKLRAELELSYSGGEGSGYQSILDGMQAEVDRLAAAGQGADGALYGDALNALAEGRKAYMDALSESYDLQHAQILAIEDETTRQAALNALNEEYNRQRAEGESAYNAAVKEAASETWTNTGMEEQLRQIDELAGLLGGPDLDMDKLAEWTANLDEGKMTSMLSLVEQLKGSGASASELAELGIDAEDLYSKLQQIKEITGANGQLQGLNTIFSSGLPEEVQRVLVGLDMTQAAEDWSAFMEDKQEFSTQGTVNITLNPLDQAAITAWEEENGEIALTGPVAKVGVALGAGWQETLRTAFEAGKLEAYGEDGLPVEVTPEVLSALEGSDLIAPDEDGTYHVIITPEVGSAQGLETAEKDMNATPLDGTFLAPLAASTQDKVDTIGEYARQIADLQAQMDQLNQTGEEFSQDGFSMDALQEMEISDVSALAENLSALSETDLSNIAAQAANLMAALASGTLDEDTQQQYQAQLQGILDLVSAADQYLGTGNNVSAGIAQGMMDYGWPASAEDLAGKIETSVNSALAIGSPSRRMTPTGAYVAAGIAQGMTEYSFAEAAASAAGGIVDAFDGMEGKGRPIGEAFGRGLYLGLQSRLASTLALARSYAAKIPRAFSGAWQIHSPSRVAERLTEMFGRGLEEGMKDWPSVSERVLESGLLSLRSGMGGAVSNTYDSRDFSASSQVTVQNLNVRSDGDVDRLAREIARIVQRGQYATGQRR